MGVELFHANRQTDKEARITKLIVTYRNFEKAPKNGDPDKVFLKKYTWLLFSKEKSRYFAHIVLFFYSKNLLVLKKQFVQKLVTKRLDKSAMLMGSVCYLDVHHTTGYHL